MYVVFANFVIVGFQLGSGDGIVSLLLTASTGQVFELLRSRSSGGDRWDLLGVQVCLKAWKFLRGIGALASVYLSTINE